MLTDNREYLLRRFLEGVQHPGVHKGEEPLIDFCSSKAADQSPGGLAERASLAPAAPAGERPSSLLTWISMGKQNEAHQQQLKRQMRSCQRQKLQQQLQRSLQKMLQQRQQQPAKSKASCMRQGTDLWQQQRQQLQRQRRQQQQSLLLQHIALETAA
ncbi:hypothetical protein WJX74_001047 [Apatococcus lobatus]|uniref:Uncharacterized protein n=1 Tax=Apatococcus lobatus TaxID=904363 RepID=A0AAW1QVH8_9CHLO